MHFAINIFHLVVSVYHMEAMQLEYYTIMIFICITIS